MNGATYVTGDERAVIDAFHRLYYDSHDTTWKQTFWRGRTVRKCALDLWVYQEILTETRPDLIVETGTYMGGSAFFMANICDLIGHGKIVTIDVSAPEGRPRHRRITYLRGYSVAPEIVARVRRRARRSKRVMVVLDSDHRRDHVSRELELYAPLVTPGCYLVVEDTNVNGHPVSPRAWSRSDGSRHHLPRDLERVRGRPVREKLLLTFNPSGYLRRT